MASSSGKAQKYKRKSQSTSHNPSSNLPQPNTRILESKQRREKPDLSERKKKKTRESERVTLSN
jgi:hypothetical protein